MSECPGLCGHNQEGWVQRRGACLQGGDALLVLLGPAKDVCEPDNIRKLRANHTRCPAPHEAWLLAHHASMKSAQCWLQLSQWAIRTRHRGCWTQGRQWSCAQA